MVDYNAERRRAALRRIMKEFGLSVNGWAVKAKVAESALREFLNDESKSLSDRTYAKLAAAIDRSPEYVRGESSAPADLPLWGYAGAGERIHLFDGDNPPPLEMIEAPPGLQNGAAVIVRGDSMMPRLRQGDVIFFEQEHMPPERLLNQECVVQLPGGTILVKQLSRGSRRNRYHLVSINPSVRVMEDEAVEWAAPIQWIRRGQGNFPAAIEPRQPDADIGRVQAAIDVVLLDGAARGIKPGSKEFAAALAHVLSEATRRESDELARGKATLHRTPASPQSTPIPKAARDKTPRQNLRRE